MRRVLSVSVSLEQINTLLLMTRKDHERFHELWRGGKVNLTGRTVVEITLQDSGRQTVAQRYARVYACFVFCIRIRYLSRSWT